MTTRIWRLVFHGSTPTYPKTRGSWPQCCKPVKRLRGDRGSHPLEYTGEEWWADVLTDPRAHRAARVAPSRGAITVYRLRDEPHASILIAYTKCDWKAAFNRDELIAQHGADLPLPELLSLVAPPGCPRVGSRWGPLWGLLRRADREQAVRPDGYHHASNRDSMTSAGVRIWWHLHQDAVACHARFI